MGVGGAEGRGGGQEGLGRDVEARVVARNGRRNEPVCTHLTSSANSESRCKTCPPKLPAKKKKKKIQT